MDVIHEAELRLTAIERLAGYALTGKVPQLVALDGITRLADAAMRLLLEDLAA